MKNKTERGLTPGQKVWVIHMTLEDRSSKPKPVPRAKIVERQFNKVMPNYLGKLGERWAIGPIEKRSEDFGFAYDPEHVYLTREAAHAALVAKIDAMISQLQTLRATV